jgi:hypothetical protein
MSHISSTNESPVVSSSSSLPRTWAGNLTRAAECATHYLHLLAFPCEKCNGPVVLGWIGAREDDISKETHIQRIGAVCLSCGHRPETLADPLAARYFRPVEWEWMIENKSEAIEPGGDPLPAELSQDADTDR